MVLVQGPTGWRFLLSEVPHVLVEGAKAALSRLTDRERRVLQRNPAPSHGALFRGFPPAD